MDRGTLNQRRTVDAGRTSREQTVADMLRTLVSELDVGTVQVGARAIRGDDVAALYEVERCQLTSASPVRLGEFATGRALLRELLRADVPIPIGPHRRPVLPPGTTGSLAHDREIAVAAVTRNTSVVALGVDVEPIDEVAPSVSDVILRPTERHLDPGLAFSIKESAYKAWSTAGGRFLEHQDVEVHVEAGYFVARVLDPGLDIQGSWCSIGGRWLTLAAISTVSPRDQPVERHLSSSPPPSGVPSTRSR